MSFYGTFLHDEFFFRRVCFSLGIISEWEFSCDDIFPKLPFLGIFSRNGVLRVYLSEFFKLIVATSSLPVLSREFTKIKL